MEYWRRSLQVTRVDRLRNDDSTRRSGVRKDMNVRIRKKRLRWIEHGMRMPGGCGLGAVWRTRTRWKDWVQEEMTKRRPDLR